MRIQVVFQFKDEHEPSAVSGVENNITDLLLPFPNDLVTHTDLRGQPFTGRVAERVFSYSLGTGTHIDGEMIVTLFLDHVTLH